MHMKVWRIAAITSAILIVSLFAFFTYLIFIKGNDVILPNIREQYGGVLLPSVFLSLFIFSFISGLITFPYYWFTSLRLFTSFADRENIPDYWEKAKLTFFGTLISCFCILLAIYMGSRYGVFNGA